MHHVIVTYICQTLIYESTSQQLPIIAQPFFNGSWFELLSIIDEMKPALDGIWVVLEVLSPKVHESLFFNSIDSFNTILNSKPYLIKLEKILLLFCTFPHEFIISYTHTIPNYTGAIVRGPSEVVGGIHSNSEWWGVQNNKCIFFDSIKWSFDFRFLLDGSIELEEGSHRP